VTSAARGHGDSVAFNAFGFGGFRSICLQYIVCAARRAACSRDTTEKLSA
jgi:hypothetical protein